MARERVSGRLGISVLVLGLGYGCGGPTNTTHESTPEGDVDGAGPPDAEAAAVACRHYFSAQYELGCGGPGLPASQKLRLETRGVQVCLNQMALPGSGMNADSVEACASALEASACQLNWGLPVACRFVGSLPGGAACNDGMQCKSGLCQGTAFISPGGQIGPTTCGTCTPAVVVGQACGQGNLSGRCGGDATCLIDQGTQNLAQPTYTCVAITEGDVGAACDDLTAICKPGLYCAAKTGKCNVLGDSGAPCGEGPSSQGAPGGCVKPLSCVGLPGNAMCSGGAAGAFCLEDLDCPPGLACIPGPCSSTLARVGCAASGTCGQVQWASPGEACDGYGTRCLMGSCGLGLGLPKALVPLPDGGPPMGICPTISADGQQCGSVCDKFAECFNAMGPAGMSGVPGTCTLLDSVVCK
jgi:hypothetical protein